MLTPENDSVIVPPISAPRKNKRVIHGKFNVLDFVIIVPALTLLLTLIFTLKLEVWTLLVIGGAIAIITTFLCWPLNFLGKDKPYIYVIRGLKFIFGGRRNLVSEIVEIDNSDEKQAIKKMPIKKEDKGGIIKDK
ncbi:MAG: hypothetical protein LBD63_01490, partial [Mycoplasmataceae bacterium]|nr:hypothetical protein [Mycoplasmataceae bacterium]